MYTVNFPEPLIEQSKTPLIPELPVSHFDFIIIFFALKSCFYLFKLKLNVNTVYVIA